MWALFAAELAGLLVLAIQRGVAERRGEESWVVGAFAPTLGSALEAGKARQAEHPELPLDEDRIRRRIQHLVTVCGLVMSGPGLSAVLLTEVPTETLLLAFAGATLIGMDVAVLAAVTVATWRGWMPLPHDGGGGDDPEPEPAPVPGGPWTRAHTFRLMR
jgi:hypothetical protein